MKRTADQTRSITAFWQIIAQTVVYKISHTLRWSSLLHIRLLPALLLNPFLEMHHSQRILQFLFRLYNIFWMCFYHHAGIAPGGTTVARTHTIHHQLLRTCSSWNHKTTRAHTEAIHTPSIYLSYKTILGCRKILSSAISVVVLYLVDELKDAPIEHRRQCPWLRFQFSRKPDSDRHPGHYDQLQESPVHDNSPLHLLPG